MLVAWDVLPEASGVEKAAVSLPCGRFPINPLMSTPEPM
jgi:hypothetical protein